MPNDSTKGSLSDMKIDTLIAGQDELPVDKMRREREEKAAAALKAAESLKPVKTTRKKTARKRKPAKDGIAAAGKEVMLVETEVEPEPIMVTFSAPWFGQAEAPFDYLRFLREGTPTGPTSAMFVLGISCDRKEKFKFVPPSIEDLKLDMTDIESIDKGSFKVDLNIPNAEHTIILARVVRSSKVLPLPDLGYDLYLFVVSGALPPEIKNA